MLEFKDLKPGMFVSRIKDCQVIWISSNRESCAVKKNDIFRINFVDFAGNARVTDYKNREFDVYWYSDNWEVVKLPNFEPGDIIVGRTLGDSYIFKCFEFPKHGNGINLVCLSLREEEICNFNFNWLKDSNKDPCAYFDFFKLKEKKANGNILKLKLRFS